MQIARKPLDEQARLAVLRRLEILDTEPEEVFDRITRLASRLLGTPISAVSLIDEQRQWFKSMVGLPVRETPRDWGFDEYCTDPTAGGWYWKTSYEKNGQQVTTPQEHYNPDVIHQFSLDFIRRHKDGPFFLYYAMHLVHAPILRTPDSKAAAGKGVDYYDDNIAYMDKQVGEIVAELEKLGLREKTLVMFSGDNGTALNYPSTVGGRMINGKKASMLEGGSRVPLIASWPGTTPAGKVLKDIVNFTDMTSTFVELAVYVPSASPHRAVRVESEPPDPSASFGEIELAAHVVPYAASPAGSERTAGAAAGAGSGLTSLPMPSPASLPGTVVSVMPVTPSLVAPATGSAITGRTGGAAAVSVAAKTSGLELSPGTMSDTFHWFSWPTVVYGVAIEKMQSPLESTGDWT